MPTAAEVAQAGIQRSSLPTARFSIGCRQAWTPPTRGDRADQGAPSATARRRKSCAV